MLLIINSLPAFDKWTASLTIRLALLIMEQVLFLQKISNGFITLTVGGNSIEAIIFSSFLPFAGLIVHSWIFSELLDKRNFKYSGLLTGYTGSWFMIETSNPRLYNSSTVSRNRKISTPWVLAYCQFEAKTTLVTLNCSKIFDKCALFPAQFGRLLGIS